MKRPHVSARSTAVGFLAASVFATSPASAGWIDEGKVGILAHDVGIFGDNVESGADVDGELIFKSPSFLKMIGSPRQDVGVSVNTDNKTSFLYLDILNWEWAPVHNLLHPGDGAYVDAFLGGAVHDGNLNHEDNGKKALGTRALYHLGASLGYQINPVNSVEVYFVHLSNAGASSHNGGINDIGIRVGFKF
ncbi:MAG TPA: acyloxyacyl hydrolase [Stellaceae bacterium]|nr:acyloxyacyl hydrolase [Stellaceae bacterium]